MAERDVRIYTCDRCGETIERKASGGGFYDSWCVRKWREIHNKNLCSKCYGKYKRMFLDFMRKKGIGNDGGEYGEWENDYVNNKRSCSLCGCEIPMSMEDRNYCPKCGNVMGGYI